MKINLDLGMKMSVEIDCTSLTSVNSCRSAVFNAYQVFWGNDSLPVFRRSWENVMIKVVIGSLSEEVTDDNFSRYRSVALLYAQIVPRPLVEPRVPNVSSYLT